MKQTNQFTSVCLGVFIVLASSVSQAESGNGSALKLREIMRDLNTHSQGVVDAISREDWARVEMLAPKIAHHPEPPAAEKVRILSFLGSDAMAFRQFDQSSHEAGAEMLMAARDKNGAAVIEAFAKVQQNCLGCHQTFRQRFIEHFYPVTTK